MLRMGARAFPHAPAHGWTVVEETRRSPSHGAGTVAGPLAPFLPALGLWTHDRSALTPGTTIAGPALFEDRETSCSVGPDCTVTIDIHHNLIIDIEGGEH